MSENHVCPADRAGILDNRLRRIIHNPKKFLKDLIREGQSVADLGCGPGTFTTDMAEMVGPEGRVYAIDLQEKMLELTEKKVAMYNLQERITLCQCGTEDLALSESVKRKYLLAGRPCCGKRVND